MPCLSLSLLGTSFSWEPCSPVPVHIVIHPLSRTSGPQEVAGASPGSGVSRVSRLPFSLRPVLLSRLCQHSWETVFLWRARILLVSSLFLILRVSPPSGPFQGIPCWEAHGGADVSIAPQSCVYLPFPVTRHSVYSLPYFQVEWIPAPGCCGRLLPWPV